VPVRKELVIDVDATLMKPLIAAITFNHLTAIVRQAADTKHRDLFRASSCHFFHSSLCCMWKCGHFLPSDAPQQVLS
jgi:hypothetical protein